MWPFIVLPIVLATGYRAVQTVWVIFMHYTLKKIYIQCTCIILGKFILARPSRVKRSKGFALHSQPLSKSHQPNPQMNVSGRLVDFFPFLCSRCHVNDVNDEGLIMEWLLNLVVDCFRSFRHLSPMGRILARRVPRSCMPLPQSSSCDVMSLGTH